MTKFSSPFRLSTSSQDRELPVYGSTLLSTKLSSNISIKQRYSSLKLRTSPKKHKRFNNRFRSTSGSSQGSMTEPEDENIPTPISEIYTTKNTMKEFNEENIMDVETILENTLPMDTKQHEESIRIPRLKAMNTSHNLAALDTEKSMEDLMKLETLEFIDEQLSYCFTPEIKECTEYVEKDQEIHTQSCDTTTEWGWFVDTTTY